MSASSFGALCVPNVAAELQRLEKERNLLSNDETHISCLDTTPKVRAAELSIETVLGNGGFSVVYRVKCMGTSESPPSDTDSDSTSVAGGSSYAMKCLSITKVACPQSLLLAARDLYYEATILTQLDHPNIIRLRGVPPDSLRNSYTQGAGGLGYFVLLDLLHGTLRGRLDAWRDQQSRFFKVSAHNGMPALPDGDLRSLAHFSGRLKIASETAHAMKYLHSKRIVFRDLKPENVGFDSADGSVKLFDFGTARGLHESFTEPAVADSFRFMAPENMLCQPSGFPADVYSFGVLLWELATLQLPYEAFFVVDKITKQPVFSQTNFTKKVILQAWRPETESIECFATKALIEQCWEAKPHARPTFELVAENVTKAYRVHRERKQEKDRAAGGAQAASNAQRPAILRSSSYTFRPKSGSAELPAPKRGLSRTVSDVGRRGGCPPRKRNLPTTSGVPSRLSNDAMPTIHSASDECSSSSFQGDDLTPKTPVRAPRKRGDSIGRRLARKTPSMRKLVRSLSSSSRTAPTERSEDLFGEEDTSAPFGTEGSVVSLKPSPDKQSSPKGAHRSISPFARRRKEKVSSKGGEGVDGQKSAPSRSKSLTRSTSGKNILRSLSGSLKRATKLSSNRSSAGSSFSAGATEESASNAVWSSDEDLSSGTMQPRPRRAHRKGVRNMVRETLHAAELSASRNHDQ